MGDRNYAHIIRGFIIFTPLIFLGCFRQGGEVGENVEHKRKKKNLYNSVIEKLQKRNNSARHRRNEDIMMKLVRNYTGCRPI